MTLPDESTVVACRNVCSRATLSQSLWQQFDRRYACEIMNRTYRISSLTVLMSRGHVRHFNSIVAIIRLEKKWQQHALGICAHFAYAAGSSCLDASTASCWGWRSCLSEDLIPRGCVQFAGNSFACYEPVRHRNSLTLQLLVVSYCTVLHTAMSVSSR